MEMIWSEWHMHMTEDILKMPWQYVHFNTYIQTAKWNNFHTLEVIFILYKSRIAIAIRGL